MSYKENFPVISVNEDLTSLPVLKAREIINIQQGSSRTGLVLVVDAVSFKQAYPDYESSKASYMPKNKSFIFYFEKDSSFYYMRSLYDKLFPWYSTKDKHISFSVCADNNYVGDVTRIFNIDSILANID